ncbi:MAG: gamma carbonic anhydrase family protein [Bacteroidota bacterium]
MALIKPFKGELPQIHSSVFLAENASVLGRVAIGENSSIWYNCVLRGDVDAILIGESTNIQDGTIIHCSTNRCPAVIGNRVTVGHRAILHGCTLEDECLVGMGAIILDEAVVPKHTLVAANSLVLEGTQLEPGFLYAGSPVRKIKALSPAQIAGIKRSAEHYIENARLHIEASEEPDEMP